MAKIKIVNIVGARPNMMKMAPLMDEMKRHSVIRPLLVHTGQHYDRRMSQVFFDDLSLPKPDIYLGVGSGTHAQQTARVMEKIEKVLIRERPGLVVVVGDVNSTIAVTLAAVKLGISVAHVEAGLRSFDRTMPEEINRIATDAVSDYLFAPSCDGVDNLRREGVSRGKIFLVGNIMIDTLLRNKANAGKSKILKKLGLQKKGYALLTLHRPSNVDDKVSLGRIFCALEEIQRHIGIVFPMHVRTKKTIERFGLSKKLSQMKRVIVTPPLGYIDFLKLMCDARVVLTDSGGIQEETTVLRIPCITLRDTTERPATVTQGTNVLVGNDTRKIIREALSVLKRGGKKGKTPPLWDGKTAKRIVRVIIDKMATNR